MLFTDAFVRAVAFAYKTLVTAWVWSVFIALLWTVARGAGLAPPLGAPQLGYVVALGSWLALDDASDEMERSEPPGQLTPYLRRLILDGCQGILIAIAVAAVLPAAFAPPAGWYPIGYMLLALIESTLGVLRCAARRQDWPAAVPINLVVDAAMGGAFVSLAAAVAAGLATSQGRFDDVTLAIVMMAGAALGTAIDLNRRGGLEGLTTGR